MLKKEKIKELEEKIGYEFKKKELIWQALTHSSFSNEQKINKYKNYERLEFLGDAVLELLSSQFFFETYPDMPEGEMTKLRSSMVCELALAYCARDISLGDYLLLGKGEEITGGRTRDSIISDVMEAVIGALYLDGGLSEADAFVKKYILSDLESKQLFYDSKTILQEEVQRDGQSLTYELVSETGPDHDKGFMVEARIDGQTVERAREEIKNPPSSRPLIRRCLQEKSNRYREEECI